MYKIFQGLLFWKQDWLIDFNGYVNQFWVILYQEIREKYLYLKF